MGAYVQAGVDIYRSTLRYAEVERDGSNHRLLKLGSCEFDFNMTKVLLNGASPVYLDTMGEALNDVFAQSMASELHIVFHPSNCYSFFTPLFVDMTAEERRWRLQEEANLLTSEGSPVPLHLTADIVYTETLPDGKVVEWFHVLGVEERVHRQLEGILKTLPPSTFRFNLSTRGTANAIAGMARKQNRTPSENAPFTLGIGYYGGHIEYVLCRQDRWHFSYHSESSAPSDSAYFALALLRRLNLDRVAVGQIYIYGEEIDAEVFSLLEEVFRLTPEVLNPVEVVALERKSPGMHFSAEAYAPCIGIAM